MAEYPEVDEYGQRFRWEANYSTGKHVRSYAPTDPDPCVVVQDAAVEAARSSSTPLTTRAAGEQATTQALPLCQHGYYASRCPTCHKETP